MVENRQLKHQVAHRFAEAHQHSTYDHKDHLIPQDLAY
jgi:hypothetical protein